MVIVLVLLRLIHILGAFVWVGIAFTQVFLISPALASSGESGLRFAKAMNARPIARMAISAAATVTVLAGILLYLVGNSASHFSQTGNIVLGIGAVAGLLAAGHGGAVTGRLAAQLGRLVNQYVTDQGMNPEGLPAIRETATKLAMHTRISFVIMLVALIFMGSARYL
ncbi:MAG: hypothetical protein IT319_04865 [Anaerolineae bacterium]|nr:hypothetical protein [Anaerolineae bacterium]